MRVARCQGVDLTILHGGSEKHAVSAASPSVGFSEGLEDSGSRNASRRGVEDLRGATVRASADGKDKVVQSGGVIPVSAADQAVPTPDDVILSINKHAVQSMDALRKLSLVSARIRFVNSSRGSGPMCCSE